MKAHTILVVVLFLSILTFLTACEKNEDVFTPNVLISGTVTNNSGINGTIFVEIQYNMRDIADSNGKYAIKVYRDYLVDSLYAYVDSNGSETYTPGEHFGFYHNPADPDHAVSIHVRSSDVKNINFAIP